MGDNNMSVDYAVIGKRIQQKRKARCMTQESLAEYLTVTVGYVSQMERGVTKISLDRLSDIAKYLDCGIEELVTGVAREQNGYLRQELELLYSELDNSQRRLLLALGRAVKDQAG